MEILGSLDELPAGLCFVATVGAFDGLHRGHERVLAATVAAARAVDPAAEAVVVTFSPHPDAVLRGEPPLVLCDAEERLARFAAAGVGHTVVQRFDRSLSQLSGEVFVRWLATGRRLLGMVMTPDSAFGRDRGGTAATIGALGDALGFEVVGVTSLAAGGAPVSASRIRGLVAGGRLGATRRLLGRRYAVIGTVVRGDGRGRALGYPTANLSFPEPVALPPDGIYAVTTSWGGDDPLHPARRASGVASLGVRPTFGGGERILEVHLLDFDEDLYDVRLRVEFVRRQRGERRFPDAESLVRQMHLDTARARSILAATASGGHRP